MFQPMSRRGVLAASLIAAPFVAGRASFAASQELGARLAALEARSGGRLGVGVLDTATETRGGHRVGERFAMCSTFKSIAAAHVLARVDRGEERLDRRVIFAENDLVPYSPATKPRAGGQGMTMGEICEAAVVLSDNTAGNLMLASFGGPAGLTRFFRSAGDTISRLDRIEPELNNVAPDDPRDTTTPGAMSETVRQILLGDTLKSASRAQLTAWMVGMKTGDARFRAGLPSGWRVASKTGSGNGGEANEAGIFWPPGRAPVALSVYYRKSEGSADQRNAVIAEAARIVAASL